jgi:nucleoside 2-deoxyribosyltransferase
MGKLAKTKGYLVGPMEFGSDNKTWRLDIQEKLSELNITFFDPYAHPFIADLEEGNQVSLKQQRAQGDLNDLEQKMKEIRRHDLAMVDKSDFIICVIKPDTPTWGTLDELVHAEGMNKPIFMHIVGGIRQCPLWLFSLVPLKHMYESMDDIVETLKKIDGGEIGTDSKRWKLLRPEYR